MTKVYCKCQKLKYIFIDGQAHECVSTEKECPYVNNDKVVGRIGVLK